MLQIYDSAAGGGFVIRTARDVELETRLDILNEITVKWQLS